MNVRDRLIEYIAIKGISKRAFALKIGASSSFVNNISQSIGQDKINSIRKVFPDLNISWLLTGDGEMLNGADTAGCTAEVRPQLDRKPVDDNIVIDYIATLKAQLATLNQVVQEKEETIKELHQQLDYYRSALERLRVAIAQDDQVTLKKEISFKTA